MKRLEVSGAVRPIYGSLGVKRLISFINLVLWQHAVLCKWYAAKGAPDYVCRVVCSLRLPQHHINTIMN